MRRGPALALTFATTIVVTASACGDDASSESSSSGGSGGASSSSGGSGSDGTSIDGGGIVNADGSSSGSESGTDGASPEGSSEGGDASPGGPKWKCSDKTRTYQNAGACQNAHDLLCQPTKAGVDNGLPCPSAGEIYITCGACNAQDDFAARECLCM